MWFSRVAHTSRGSHRVACDMVAMTPAEIAASVAPFTAGFTALLVLSLLLLAPRTAFEKGKRKQCKWDERVFYSTMVVSLTHGCAAAVTAAMTGLEAGLWPLAAPWDLHATSDATILCISLFIGYLLADLVPLFYYRTVWPGTGMYIGHHVASILSWGSCLLLGTCHCVAVALMLCEATAPFVNGRYFLSTHGLKDSPLYAINGVMMALSFLVVRVVGMGLVGFKVFILGRSSFFALHPAQTAILLPIFVFGYGLQLTWFQRIVTGLVAFLRPPKDPKKAS